MSEAKPEYLIKSMLFIPFQNAKGYSVPILGVGWTLNYEVFFYLIFFVAICLNQSYRSLIACTAIVCLTGIGQIFGGNSILNYYTNSFLLEFALGILAFYIVEYLLKKLKGSYFRIISLILAIVSFVWMFLDLTKYSTLPRCVRIGIPALIFFCAMLLWGKTMHFNNFYLELGNMSFSIYLIEYFTTAIYKIIVKDQTILTKIMCFIVIMIITLSISYISYRVIEVKITNWLKKKIISS